MPVECLGCIVKPFTAPRELTSEVEIERHFQAADDDEHTEDLKQRTIEKLTRATADRESPAPSFAPSEDQIVDKWIQESAEEGYFLQNVSVGRESEQRDTKQADLVVVPTPIENAGVAHLADAVLVNRPVMDPGPPKQSVPGTEFGHVLENIDGDPIEVQVYEAKRVINPHAVGQVVFYSRFLPDEVPPDVEIDIVDAGIIYVERDELTEEFAQEQGISLHRISESAF